MEEFIGEEGREGNNKEDKQGKRWKKKGKQRGRRMLCKWMFKIITTCINDEENSVSIIKIFLIHS